MVVSVCLSSNLYYSLLGFFSDCLSVCWPVTQTFCVLCMSSLPVYVCVCLFVCLSVWENDRMGFRLLFESISSFYLLHQTSPGGIAPDHMALLKSAQSVCYPLAM